MQGFLLLIPCVQVLFARSIVDLTHTLDEDTPTYSLRSFGVENLTWYKNEQVLATLFPEQGVWLEARKMEIYEHQGTHIDAPSHVGRGRQQLHEIPPERLIGPGVVINVRSQVEANPDYLVTVDDIKEYERQYGRIPPGAIVMMDAGWSARYPFRDLIFNSDDFFNFSTYHYPGWSIEACRMLNTERDISVLGTDGASIDNQLGFLDCHRYLQPLNVPILEYVANLHNIPPNGTTIFIGAPKIRAGTGAPTRIFAIVDDNVTQSTNASGAVTIMPIFVLLLNLISTLLPCCIQRRLIK